MTFSISLEHTKNETWQQLREQQWASICRQSFPSDATEKELKPYRDYFFDGDVESAISSGKFNGFRALLFWAPTNNLEDIKSIFIYYWKWFFSDEENIKIYQGYKFGSPDEYLNSILLELAGWTYYQPPELMAELFLWVFGEKYDESRIFPIPLGNDNWQPKISVNHHALAFSLARGVRGYLFSYKDDSIYPKYAYLVDFLVGVFIYIDPEIYSTKRVNRDVQSQFDSSDQNIMRWFVANLEGVTTKREIKKNNGEIPHNDMEKEAILRDNLNKLDLPEEYNQLVNFVHEHGKKCLNHFDD